MRKPNIDFQELKEKFLYIITSPWRFFKALCFSVGLVTILILGSITLVLTQMYLSLPDLNKMKFKNLRTKAIVVTGKRFQSKSQARRYRWASIRKINRDLLFAVVMSEDSNFFKHGGINYNALLDSIAENIKARDYKRGASTITQQVVKNVFLTREKSLTRKIKEYFISKRLEARFKKNEILEIYLNIAEFGPDIYGVQMASKAFFKKHPKSMNAAEGAFLALMLPSPRKYYYSVFQNKNLTRNKRKKLRRILSDMAHNEYIGAKDYRKYIRYKYFK